MGATEHDLGSPEDDFEDFDLCEVADQLDRAYQYIDVADPLGDDLIIPASVLADQLAWMFRAYDNTDHVVGQVEILRRLSYAFHFIFGAEFGDLPTGVEEAKEAAILALRRLEDECQKAKLN